MSNIESQIIVDVPYDVDISKLIEYLKEVISSTNGKPTMVNVIEMDNPIAGNLINVSKEL